MRTTSGANRNYRQMGFSLIEVMLTVGIVGVSLASALPSLTTTFERQRLRSAANSIVNHVYLARSEAISLRQPVSISFDSNAWCVGVTTAQNCDCTVTDPSAATACVLPAGNGLRLSRYSSDQHPGVSIALSGFNAASATTFEPIRGGTTAGSINLTGSNGEQLRATVNRLGRVALCTPGAAAVPGGYSTC